VRGRERLIGRKRKEELGKGAYKSQASVRKKDHPIEEEGSYLKPIL